jgi:hypothetical protein
MRSSRGTRISARRWSRSVIEIGKPVRMNYAGIAYVSLLKGLNQAIDAAVPDPVDIVTGIRPWPVRPIGAAVVKGQCVMAEK